jgi:integrase
LKGVAQEVSDRGGDGRSHPIASFPAKSIPQRSASGSLNGFGWHTFRHTYSTLLKANGEDIKVVQELLRHANSRITLDIYTQALTPAKREAQSRIANLILPKKTMVGESVTNPFKPSLTEAGSAN